MIFAKKRFMDKLLRPYIARLDNMGVMDFFYDLNKRIELSSSSSIELSEQTTFLYPSEREQK